MMNLPVPYEMQHQVRRLVVIYPSELVTKCDKASLTIKG